MGKLLERLLRICLIRRGESRLDNIELHSPLSTLDSSTDASASQEPRSDC